MSLARCAWRWSFIFFASRRKEGWTKPPLPRRSAIVARQPRDARELDAFVVQVARLVVRGLAVYVALLGLAVMDAARLLGEAGADIIGRGLDLVAQLAQGAQRRRRLLPRLAALAPP